VSAGAASSAFFMGSAAPALSALCVFSDDYPALLRARRRRERWTEEDRRLYRRHRWRSEGSHGEAKTWHGLARAVRRGLANMKIQAYLTAAAIGYSCASSALACSWSPFAVLSSRKSLREGHNRADRCVELTNSQLLQRPHRTALHGHIAPHGRERAGQACAAVDDEEVRPPQAALDEIVEHGAPAFADRTRGAAAT
jgi:Transposase DDE domain